MTDSSTAEVRDKGLLLLSQRFAAWLAAADVPLKRTLAIYESSAVFEFEVPARTRGQQQSIVQNPSRRPGWEAAMLFLTRLVPEARLRASSTEPV